MGRAIVDDLRARPYAELRRGAVVILIVSIAFMALPFAMLLITFHGNMPPWWLWLIVLLGTAPTTILCLMIVGTTIRELRRRRTADGSEVAQPGETRG